MRRIVSALLLLVASSSAAADFTAGLEACLRGDYAMALREFRPLAEQGNAAAQFSLGLMYANGEGVPEDDIQAYAWFNLAAAQGLGEGEQGRAHIRQYMTPAQITEAQKLSRQLAAWIADGSGVQAPAPISGDPVRPPELSRDTVRQVSADVPCSARLRSRADGRIALQAHEGRGAAVSARPRHDPHRTDLRRTSGLAQGRGCRPAEGTGRARKQQRRIPGQPRRRGHAQPSRR